MIVIQRGFYNIVYTLGMYYIKLSKINFGYYIWLYLVSNMHNIFAGTVCILTYQHDN